MTTWNLLRHCPAFLLLSLLTGPPQKTHLMLVVEAGFAQASAGSYTIVRSSIIGDECSSCSTYYSRVSLKVDVDSGAA